MIVEEEDKLVNKYLIKLDSEPELNQRITHSPPPHHPLQTNLNIQHAAQLSTPNKTETKKVKIQHIDVIDCDS